MGSIGNDIVALKAVDAERTIIPKFYTKILAGSELTLHQSNCPGIPFYQFVWLAWSVKEAAYKCLKRLQPELVFSPTRTVISAIQPPAFIANVTPTGIHQTGINVENCYHIEVSINSRTLYVRSIIYSDELIHSIASLSDDLTDIKWGLNKIASTDPDDQSVAVRAFLNSRFAGEVYKDDTGIPSLYIDDKQVPVSFSHHEEWVGYALPYVSF